MTMDVIPDLLAFTVVAIITALMVFGNRNHY